MIATRLKKEHYDRKTKLEQPIEYYDCPACMMMKEDLNECPSCTNRACLPCLEAFSRVEHGKDPTAKGKGIYKCIMCLKFLQQKPMNKFLARLLFELKFKCDDCRKSYSYERIKAHKSRGECQRGAYDEEDGDAIMDQFQPNARQNAELIKSIFVLERDSKFIHEYVFQTKTLVKHQVNMTANFPHNFQGVQTPTGRLFLIGGGDYNKMPDSLFECYEITVQESQYNIINRDKMKYARHGHSACSLGDKFIVVTGSRKETDQAQLKAECYNVDIDIWFDLPQMNEGRHYHASCSFLDRFVYVFCGISNATKKYINTIERMDNQTKKSWELISFPADQFAARQGLGVAQLNKDEILIFGGFNGKYMKEAHILNCTQKKIKAADSQPNMELFLFQMPTVFEQVTGSVFSVDWQKMKVIQYHNKAWNIVADIRGH